MRIEPGAEEYCMSSGEAKSVGLEQKLKSRRSCSTTHMFHTGEGKVKSHRPVVLRFCAPPDRSGRQLPRVQEDHSRKRKRTCSWSRKYVPPPPKIERKQIVKKKFTRKVPIPDPTPDEPEPIREPEPEIEPEPIPPDVDVLIGVPEPPPRQAVRCWPVRKA